MARKVVQKTSFLGGEAGPLVEGRSDLAQFQLGVAPGQNFISLKGGAKTRRPGTRFVQTTLNNKPARLLPFLIRTDDPTQMYVLEVSLASSTSLAFQLIRQSDKTAVAVSGSPLTVASSINLDEIQFTQSAGAMFITHRAFTPQVLYIPALSVTPTLANYVAFPIASRSGGLNEWFSVPYRNANITSTTLSINTETVGTGRVVTASAAIFETNAVIGSYYRMKTSGGSDGYFKITGWNSTTEVVVTVLSAISAAASATTDWSESAWSPYRGHPRTCTFYNQRLVFGGNTTEPDTFWMSQQNDFYQMSAASSGISDPLKFTLSSQQLNQIRWMCGGKKLTIGTSSSEWVGTVTNDGTNLFVQFDEETTHGSAPVQPFRNSYAIPFVTRSGKEIREMEFNFDSDAYQATDLNLFGGHVAAQTGDFAYTQNIRIVQMALQKSPLNILWVLDSVGRVFGLTRDKQQQIASWHTHLFGGVHTDRADGKPIVKSICVVPNIYGTADVLWLCVSRQINGTEKFHVEYMDEIKANPTIEPFKGQSSQTIDGVIYTVDDYAAFLDCAKVSFEATATTSFNNNDIAHLASHTAYVVAAKDTDADGGGGAIVYAGSVAIDASGSFTLPVAAKTAVVGLHADAVLRLLPIEGGEAPPVNMNATKGADSVAIRMHETWGLRIGKNRVARQSGNELNTTFEPIEFPNTSLPTIETFTGVKTIPVPCDEGTDISFALAMQEPWPCTILSLSTRITGNEV